MESFSSPTRRFSILLTAVLVLYLLCNYVYYGPVCYCCCCCCCCYCCCLLLLLPLYRVSRISDVAPPTCSPYAYNTILTRTWFSQFQGLSFLLSFFFQIKEESFLEDVNNLLNAGEVPNLFPLDEKQEICEKMRVLDRFVASVCQF